MLADYLYAAVRDALDGIPEDERSDIYVASLFTYDEEDDPRKPTVAVGYNTESDVAPSWDGSEDLEARWNLFMPGQLGLLFDSAADPSGAELREGWARENGLWYELADGESAAFNARGAPLTEAFVAMEVEVVRRLHADGDVVRIFGRPIPVLIHELEYYDKIAEQNLAANPPELVEEFARFCREG